jgi:hypothetical protein
MELSLRYAAVRSRLRNYLSGHERMLDAFRVMRCALVQGPWQSWLIRRYRLRTQNPPLPVNDRTLFPGVDSAESGRELTRDACATGFQVPASLVEEIVDYARAVGGKRIDHPDQGCEAIRTLIHDPVIVDVARRYLQAEPVFLKSQIYWTVPDGTAIGNAMAAAEGGRFHYDLADIQAVTVFIYLTDVDAHCGPHVVIRGTQRRRTPAQIFRRFLTDEYAERVYGDRIEMITGPRGTAWFEDITCYHKQAPAEQVRGMLYLIYSLHRKPEAAA